MDKRLNIQELQPEAYKAMYALEKYLTTTDLPKNYKELIKIRASQINGCPFCIDMHTKDAIKGGETSRRIFLLNAWRETDLFTEEEKLVLAMTEEVTLISNGGLTANTCGKLTGLFGKVYIAQLLMMIVTINAWNRIAISTNLPVSAV
ncbi:MAG: carboxymuconolactone decarboxylase family protein [Rhizobacter sp.]|nr:carboxymuconolactone decarboxylase family protein [Ferruginibacter sp.]